jgi:hypothetical protein
MTVRPAVIVMAAAAAALLPVPDADAQWASVADRNLPRTPSGEPDLDAPAPTTPDGEPDLSGVWLPVSDFQPPVSVEHMPLPRHFVNVAADLKPEEVPFQPWAAELFQERLADEGKSSPLAYCKPSGVPMFVAVPLPYKIIQMPELVVMLHEENSDFRQIFMDGREPVEDALPRWMGYSTGRWEGDALVVTTVGLTEQSWLDGIGHPHTEQLRVTERFRRVDAGQLEVQVTLEDPGAYTKPITYTVSAALLADQDLLEYFCTENEKSIQHFQ